MRFSLKHASREPAPAAWDFPGRAWIQVFLGPDCSSCVLGQLWRHAGAIALLVLPGHSRRLKTVTGLQSKVALLERLILRYESFSTARRHGLEIPSKPEGQDVSTLGKERKTSIACFVRKSHDSRLENGARFSCQLCARATLKEESLEHRCDKLALCRFIGAGCLKGELGSPEPRSGPKPCDCHATASKVRQGVLYCHGVDARCSVMTF